MRKTASAAAIESAITSRAGFPRRATPKVYGPGVPLWDAERTVDPDLARQLLREQFPDLASLPIVLLGSGWDNTVFTVGGDWIFRFPRREVVLPGFRLEIEYLPRLAPLLPVPIPVPERIGEPSDAFPWPFFGARFLPGVELCQAADTPREQLAVELARFLRTLHGPELLESVGAELPENWTRRADMERRVPYVLEKLAELDRLWPAPAHVRPLVESARTLPPPEPRAVCHGDLHFRHVLVDGGGRMSGVIDWIDLCRGEPALDLQLVWMALPPGARELFYAEYGAVDDETLLRARVVAFHLALALLEFGRVEGIDWLEREARASLDRVASP
jgi:aminoglycoside phosphotransferase (APT) family kinase protein